MSKFEHVEHTFDNKLNINRILYWFIAAGGTFFDGLCIFLLSISIPLIHLTMVENSFSTGFLAAAIVLGSAISAFWGGRLADRFGRKPIMIINMVFCAIAAIISFVAGNVYILIVAQLILGLAVGMDFPTAAAYISEIIPKKHRSVMLIATISLQAVGMIIGAFLGFLVLSLTENGMIWHELFIIELVVAVVFLVARLKLPESPKWLQMRGKFEEAQLSISKLTDTPYIAPNYEKIRKKTEAQENKAVSTVSLRDLFRPRFINQTILCAGAWFCMDVATYGVGLFTPSILTRLHLTSQFPPGVVAVRSSDVASGYIDLFLLFGFMFAVVLALFINKIRMQLIGFIGMTVGMLMIAISSYLDGYDHGKFVVAMLGFVVFNFLMNAGPNSTTFALPAMLYPTKIRGQASGFAAMAGKVGATLGCFSLPIVQDKFGGSSVLFLMAVFSALGLLITWIYGRKVERLLGDKNRRIL